MTVPIHTVVISAEKDVLEMLDSDPLYHIVGVFDSDPKANTGKWNHLGSDEDWPGFKHAFAKELWAVIAHDDPLVRRRLAYIYRPDIMPSIISSKAHVSKNAILAPNSIIQMGAMISADVIIGPYCKINIGASIHHDCVIGDYCTIGPGARILGRVNLDENVYVGANATILPRISVGAGAIIGAGAVVNKPVKVCRTIAGVPGREI